MRAYQFDRFGVENLRFTDLPDPTPGPDEVLVDVRAISLNYRDVLVLRGHYNPKLRLPATPVSDGAGVVLAVGANVREVAVGAHVVGHFVTAWRDGPFRAEYVGSTLGCPGPGLAAERVVLPAAAVLPIPVGYDFAEAATLPIAALTAWSAVVTEGRVTPGQTILALGTGGVSIFALQIGKALGARVLITSSSDEKLARAKALGADVGINYRKTPEWDRAVLEATGGQGVDVTVETGGIGTLDRSLRCTRGGGVIAMLGALTGLQGPINLSFVLMKRLRIAGIMVDSLARFQEMNTFLARHAIRPVIDRRFDFRDLPAALGQMESGAHFGKIVAVRDAQ